MPLITHIFGNKEKLLIWAYRWLFGGSDRVPLDRRWVGFPLLSPAELGWDRNMVVGGDTGPKVPHTSRVFGNKETLF